MISTTNFDLNLSFTLHSIILYYAFGDKLVPGFFLIL